MIETIQSIIDTGDPQKIAEYMKTNDLVIEDDKIVYRNKSMAKYQTEYWDKRQLVKKINLNS